MTAEIVQFPVGGFRHIYDARFVEEGTIADLKMESGRVYRAVWMEHGRITAWWPMDDRRKKPIGLYEPESFKVVKR
jgi:hypothetical protein